MPDLSFINHKLVLNAVRITCDREVLYSCLHLGKYDHSQIFKLEGKLSTAAWFVQTYLSSVVYKLEFFWA